MGKPLICYVPLARTLSEFTSFPDIIAHVGADALAIVGRQLNMHLLCNCGASNDSIIRKTDFLLFRSRLERHLQVKFPSTNPKTPTDHHVVFAGRVKNCRVSQKFACGRRTDDHQHDVRRGLATKIFEVQKEGAILVVLCKKPMKQSRCRQSNPIAP